MVDFDANSGGGIQRQDVGLVLSPNVTQRDHVTARERCHSPGRPDLVGRPRWAAFSLDTQAIVLHALRIGRVTLLMAFSHP